MAERTVELDEPIMDEESVALQNAVQRAERAEAELAKLKAGAAHAPAASGAAGKSGAPVAATTDFDNSEDAQKIASPKASSSTAEPDRSSAHLVEPGSMDARKQPAAQSPEGHAVGEPEARGVDALREDSMMAHLLDSLEAGKDIGHYGRLTFAMIARHFLDDDEVLSHLTKDRDFPDEKARQMLVQVEGRDYSPPRRDRILQWQAEQEFPIIPDRHDPDCGNVYKNLRFPKQTYDHIGHYQEEKASD